MNYKKYKHEELIRNIAVIALLISMILMKIGKTPIQLAFGIIGFIICTICGIYFIYKGSKLGGKMMLCISVVGLLAFLSWYYSRYSSRISYNLTVPIPTLFMIAMFLGYRMIITIDDKLRIKKIKKDIIIATVFCSLLQVIMIITAFVRY